LAKARASTISTAQFKVLQRPLRVLKDARRCNLQEEEVRVE
jgi:hypothetical protein